MSYDLEDGIPLPPQSPAGLRPAYQLAGPTPVYPIGWMEVGQSFVVPRKKAKAIKSVMWRWQRRKPDRRWVTAIEGENLRIWRVA